MDIDHITFATFFPDCEDIHLTKDVGYIPYVLYRDFGYDSCIISYRNGDYPGLEVETPGLKLMFMKKGLGYLARDSLRALFKKKEVPIRGVESFCVLMDALPMMLKHGKHIDVLQLYHLDDESIMISWLYRIVNRKGIVYLKLDMNPQSHELSIKPERVKKRSIFYRRAPIDLMSIETRETYEYMRRLHPFFKLFGDNLLYIPDGVDVEKMAPYIKEFHMKENVILHAGRIGTWQKASHVVLEVFSKVAPEYPGWRLIMIGPMEQEFKTYFDNFLEEHKDIQGRVSYLGFIPRDQVYEQYGRSKVLAFPSRQESFGLVVAEAGLCGAVALATDISALRDLTDCGKLGYLCPVDDVECFIATLRRMLGNQSELASRSKAVSVFIRDRFDWKQICENLDQHIRLKMKINGNSK